MKQKNPHLLGSTISGVSSNSLVKFTHVNISICNIMLPTSHFITKFDICASNISVLEWWDRYKNVIIFQDWQLWWNCGSLILKVWKYESAVQCAFSLHY